jgi:bacterioferritin-associated ferredoxin
LRNDSGFLLDIESHYQNDRVHRPETEAMLVCHCHCVTDRTIRDVIRSGAGSAAQVGSACGAGTACGGCRSEVQSIVDSESSLVHLGARRNETLAETG